MLEKARIELKRVWGYESFRGLQQEALTALFQRESGLLVMPTGAGKSLCYQLPSLIFDNLTLVVSPLIALMKDQVEDLRKRGIEAYALNSSMLKPEKEKVLDRIKTNQRAILFVTPERFRKPEFMDVINNVKISLFAVDEAHCISQWGQDFRPDYSRLGEIREQLGRPLTLALTATATPEVRADIVKQLFAPGEKAHQWVDSIERPNLFLRALEVYGLDEKLRALVGLKHHVQGSAIVYVSLISTLYKILDGLKKLGIEPLVYHGDLERRERMRMQEKFMESDKEWILATPAFGLGINKANIRQVIHAETPGSIEAYYQEVGRAGRDGLLSECTFLYDADDLPTQMEFINWANPDAEYIRALFLELKRNLIVVQQQGLDVLRERMNFYNRRDFRVETVLNMLERFDIIEWPNHDTRRLQIIGDIEQLDLNADMNTRRKNSLLGKLHRVVEWAKSDECRKKYIYEYFGVTVTANCGACDNCEKMK